MAMKRSLDYMGLKANTKISDIKIDKISDIINLTDKYPYDKQVQYNIDILPSL